jgi:hypothetical protein
VGSLQQNRNIFLQTKKPAATAKAQDILRLTTKRGYLKSLILKSCYKETLDANPGSSILLYFGSLLLCGEQYF